MAEKKAAPKKSAGFAENRGKQQAAVKALPAPDAEEQDRRLATLATSALFNGAGVVQPFQKNLVGEVTADGIYEAMQAKLKTVQAGDMSAIESMLLSQAVSLQTIFASLARKAAVQEYLKQYQAHLTLALKAQAQSRATLEALIELKHPRHPPTFVRQANIAHGPQQVNQHMYAQMQGHNPAQAHAHAANQQTAPNKLLEGVTHEAQGIPAPGRIADPVAVGGAGEG